MQVLPGHPLADPIIECQSLCRTTQQREGEYYTYHVNAPVSRCTPAAARPKLAGSRPPGLPVGAPPYDAVTAVTPPAARQAARRPRGPPSRPPLPAAIPARPRPPRLPGGPPRPPAAPRPRAGPPPDRQAGSNSDRSAPGSAVPPGRGSSKASSRPDTPVVAEAALEPYRRGVGALALRGFRAASRVESRV